MKIGSLILGCGAVMSAYLTSGCGRSTDPTTVDAASTSPDARLPDAAIQSCFPLSGPSAEVPDAIPSSFSAASPTWMRPIGEECPASELDEVAVPFSTVCYENDTGAAMEVLFEVIVDDESPKPVAVIYEGAAIATPATQCAAVGPDLVLNAAEVYYTVPAQGKVTFVASLQAPVTTATDFQFVVSPAE